MSDRSKTRREFITDSARGAAAAGAVLTAAQFNKVLGANDRIRLGVIGTGNRGQDVMGFFLKEPDAEVVAVCDVYEKAMNEAREKTEGRAKTYGDYRELLAAKDVDAVLIATPDHWHAQMAVDACRAGKDVYVEKPLTWAWQEGHKIIEAVRDNKRVLQVGLQQRSGTHYAEAKRQFVDSGKLGKIAFVRTWWHGNTYHLRKPNFTEQPAGLDWKKWLGPARYRPFNAHQFYNWRAYFDFGGGQITDLFTHWIDVVHWYLGDDLPVAATAAGGVYHYKDGRTAPDTISIQLEYPKEWLATFEATLVPGGRGAAIEFMGTGGRLYIDRGGYTFQEAAQRRQAPPEPVTGRAAMALETEHVRNFLACVKSRQKPSSDVVSGHRSALASNLGKIAYLQKRRITFDPAVERNYVMS
ncbi:MAG TPA: Gfo/Idh/MocA family oxidoreductase [Blastocatellia bacterium]|nr:Gfo/Idh/MocA family oxidoreductase [Blastocatellia bacterium]